MAIKQERWQDSNRTLGTSSDERTCSELTEPKTN